MASARALVLLLVAVDGSADQSTYVPVSRSGSQQLNQGQPQTPATGQFQTPAGPRPVSTQEMLTQAKEKLPADQYEAFEKAMRKIEPGTTFSSETVIDGTNIPLHIIFNKGGSVVVVNAPAPPAPGPAAAPAPAPMGPPPLDGSSADAGTLTPQAAAAAAAAGIQVPAQTLPPAPVAAPAIAEAPQAETAPLQRAPATPPAATTPKPKAVAPAAKSSPASKYPPPPPASSALGFPVPGKAAVVEP